jgi:endonuclease I/chitodextrinase
MSSLSYAQIPAGYYASATGTGYVLKTQLFNKIKSHTNNTYAGLWITYSTSDRDLFYENDNSVLDIYSEKPSATDPYVYNYSLDQCGSYISEGNCYNREHIIPQSIFGSASPMFEDAHFVIPADGYVNGMRSNHPHGNVAVASWTSLNGSKRGTSAVNGYTGTVFEPLDEFKGDIARMYFYFATRYENLVASYTSYPMFNGTSNQVFSAPFLSMLITWHIQDPVSVREITRNNAIYLRQNNRNPFIDHPEYVNLIWGNSSDIQAPSIPTNLLISAITPVSLQLNWSASTDNVAVTGYDVYVNGAYYSNVIGTSINIINLTNYTSYSFYVVAKDAAGNESANSATLSATTPSIPDTTPPTNPKNITFTAVTGTTISLKWSNASDNVGVTSYDVYVNGVFSNTITSTSATITGLTQATTYSFYIIAKDANGNASSPSTSASFNTCDCF